MPVDHQAYFDRRASRYDARLLRNRWPRNQERKAAFVHEALGGDVELLLDVGCGTGQLLEELLRRGACRRAVGIEPASGMLELARRRLADASGRVRLQNDTAEAITLPDGAVDAAVGVDLLHHLQTPERAVVEIARVVRPGGTVVFLESNVRFPLTFVIGLSSREERGMFRTSGRSLRALLEGAGLVDVDVAHVPLFTPPGPPRLVPLYDRLDRLLARTPLLRRCAIFYRATGTVPPKSTD